MRLRSPSIRWIALAGSLIVAAAHADPVRRLPQPGANGDREVIVVNRSGRTVNEIYVSPNRANQWGEDRLGEDTLASGQSLRIALGRSRDCAFDVQVVYENATREDKHAVNVCRAREVVFDGSEAAPIPPPAVATHTVTLTNRSGRPIQQVFISPADASQWGGDQLRDGTLSVGAERAIAYSGACQADLRVVFDNRAAEERRGIDVCAITHLVIVPGWTTADTPPTNGNAEPLNTAAGGGTVPVSVVNHSGHDILQLYIFPAGAPDHGPGLLDDMLKNGAAATFRIPRIAGCTYTARIVSSSSTPGAERPDLNLCTQPELVLAP